MSILPALGITLGHHNESARRTAALANQAEEAGLDLIGVADSQSIFRECFVQLTACGLATTRIRLGPLVTNPITRHSEVIASAIATIDELSGRRAYLAIGNGASAVANVGERPATAAVLDQAVASIRKKLGQDDEDVRPMHTWPHGSIPIMIHASRSNGLRLAARQGDGVLLRWGDIQLAALPERIRTLRTLHAEGPRARQAFSVWVYASVWLGETEEGRNLFGPYVSARAMTLTEDQIPEQDRAALRRYKAMYDYSLHGSSDDRRNSVLLEKFGLFDSMLDRYVLRGGQEAVTRCFEQLGDLGVETVILSGAVPDKPALIDAIANLKVARA